MNFFIALKVKFYSDWSSYKSNMCPENTHWPYNCVGLHMNGAIALWAIKKKINVGDERNLSAAHYPVPLHPNGALLDWDVLTMKAIRVQWTHCHVNLLKMAIRKWGQCGHKGTGILLNRLFKHLTGTKAPEVCKENIFCYFYLFFCCFPIRSKQPGHSTVTSVINKAFSSHSTLEMVMQAKYT